ncbi:MAG: 6-phosphogluconolactonase [Pseudomonadota bacterium]
MNTHAICHDREIASASLCDQIVQILEQAIRRRGEASLVVSGGTSPARFFELLSQASLPWHKVSIIPSDERLVPLDSDERNERMISNALSQGVAGDAKIVSLVSDVERPERTEDFANNNLANIARPFDAVILGMGSDGHTASLFPDATNLNDALASNQLCAIQNVPSQQRVRISLTPSALLSARHLKLLMFGEAKKTVLESAKLPGPVEQYPVRIALHQRDIPVSIYWAP